MTKSSGHCYLLALGSVGELVQDVVQHGGQSVRQLGPEEGLLDVLGEVVEHVHGLPGQGQVGPALSLVLGQLAGSAGLLLLALTGPLGRVVHVVLREGNVNRTSAGSQSAALSLLVCWRQGLGHNNTPQGK